MPSNNPTIPALSSRQLHTLKHLANASDDSGTFLAASVLFQPMPDYPGYSHRIDRGLLLQLYNRECIDLAVSGCLNFYLGAAAIDASSKFRITRTGYAVLQFYGVKHDA